MKEIILVTANWCNACHAMEQWFSSVEIPEIKLKSMDVSELMGEENITSLPSIIFREDGKTVQTLYGAMGKHEFISKVYSIWPEERQ